MNRRIILLTTLACALSCSAYALAQDNSSALPPAQQGSQTTPPSADDAQNILPEPSVNPIEEAAHALMSIPIDDAIKLTIDPIRISNIVDRVTEPCIITLRCPGALNAQFYLLPVDSPYGGVAIDKPVVLGEINKPSDQMTLHWSGKGPSTYVKVFAVVHKKSAPGSSVRCRAIDVALGSGI